MSNSKSFLRGKLNLRSTNGSPKRNPTIKSPSKSKESTPKRTKNRFTSPESQKITDYFSPNENLLKSPKRKLNTTEIILESPLPKRTTRLSQNLLTDKLIRLEKPDTLKSNTDCYTEIVVNVKSNNVGASETDSISTIEKLGKKNPIKRGQLNLNSRDISHEYSGDNKLKRTENDNNIDISVELTTVTEKSKIPIVASLSHSYQTRSNNKSVSPITQSVRHNRAKGKVTAISIIEKLGRQEELKLNSHDRDDKLKGCENVITDKSKIYRSKTPIPVSPSHSYQTRSNNKSVSPITQSVRHNRAKGKVTAISIIEKLGKQEELKLNSHDRDDKLKGYENVVTDKSKIYRSKTPIPVSPSHSYQTRSKSKSVSPTIKTLRHNDVKRKVSTRAKCKLDFTKDKNQGNQPNSKMNIRQANRSKKYGIDIPSYEDILNEKRICDNYNETVRTLTNLAFNADGNISTSSIKIQSHLTRSKIKLNSPKSKIDNKWENVDSLSNSNGDKENIDDNEVKGRNIKSKRKLNFMIYKKQTSSKQLYNSFEKYGICMPSYEDILRDKNNYDAYNEIVKNLVTLIDPLPEFKTDLLQEKTSKIEARHCKHMSREVTISALKTNLDYLTDICEEKVYCERHEKYKNLVSRNDLTYNTSMILFTNEQKQLLVTKLCKYFSNNSLCTDYYFKVLLPELCLKIFMDEYSLSYKEATEYLDCYPIDIEAE